MQRSSADTTSAPPAACTTTHCITCGDVALPLTVLRVDDARGLAQCSDDAGNHETVQTDLVAPVAIGDRLLVHAGTAIARLTEQPPDEVRHQRASFGAGVPGTTSARS